MCQGLHLAPMEGLSSLPAFQPLLSTSKTKTEQLLNHFHILDIKPYFRKIMGKNLLEQFIYKVNYATV